MPEDGCELWPEADRPEYRPVEPPIMPVVYDLRYETILTNLNYALDTGELSERVLALTGAMLEQNPAHYTSLTIRRRCIWQQLLQLPGVSRDAPCAEDTELVCLASKYGINLSKVGKRLQPQPKPGGGGPEQLEVIGRELGLVNGIIVAQEQYKNFQLWHHKRELITYCGLLGCWAGAAPSDAGALTEAMALALDAVFHETAGVCADSRTATLPGLPNLPLAYRELVHSYYILCMDKKNYHCHDYIAYLVQLPELRDSEPVVRALINLFTNELRADPWNNSFYHILLCLHNIRHRGGHSLALAPLIDEALALCTRMPDNEAPFGYLQSLLLAHRGPLDAALVRRVCEAVSAIPQSPFAAHLQWALLHRCSHLCGAKRLSSFKCAISQLQDTDPVHRCYWEWLCLQVDELIEQQPPVPSE